MHYSHSIKTFLFLLKLSMCLTVTSFHIVTPDDSNAACHHCYNLQHYLLNVTKYFTSNTQLLFLPGLHHLHTDLIIQNVHNISLIGSTANGTTLDTVMIQCKSSVGITMSNITDLTMENICIRNCHKKDIITKNFKKRWTYANFKDNSVFLKNCYNVYLNKITIIKTDNTWSYKHLLLTLNTLGNSSFVDLTCNRLMLLYNEAHVINNYHNLLIVNYRVVPNSAIKYYDVFNIITVQMSQYSYSVNINVLNTKFGSFSDNLLDLQLMPNTFGNLIQFNSCIFTEHLCNSHPTRSKMKNSILYLESQEITDKSYICTQHHQIKFTNCKLSLLKQCKLIYVNGGLTNTEIKDCIFKNSFFQVIQINNYLATTIIHFKSILYHEQSELSTVLISNTTFINITLAYRTNLIQLNGAVLRLEDWVIFTNFYYQLKYTSHLRTDKKSAIIFVADIYSMIICHGYIEFLNNEINAIEFSTDYGDINTNKFIIVQENSFIKITRPHIARSLDEIPPEMWKEILKDATYFVPLNNLYNSFNNLPCYFQYFSKRGNLDREIANGKFSNFSIMIDKDLLAHYLTTQCRWIPGSAFNTTRPVVVNKKMIRDFPLPPKVLCVCSKDSKPDCYTDTLATVYPGQLLTAMLSLNHTMMYPKQKPSYQIIFPSIEESYGKIVTVEMNDKRTSPTACKLANPAAEGAQIVDYDKCTSVNYTIVHSTLSYLKWCELFVTVPPNYFEGYYVNMLPCPAGFIQLNGICICDPILTRQLSITTCDINDQTILRPAGSWLSAVTINDSHQYHISPHCPLHYCLPQSSQLNFSTPNSQCQFNRTGLLCGHCQQDFSTVFGSSHCHHCFNIYLLFVLPIAVAGVSLVLLLFVLDITVTDGDINGFILYVNIISINSHVFFPQCSSYIKFWYVFVSLTNLDLGIPTCFYNGMDDYAKMWLQLTFPAYLILIATLLIIASRHSTKVQRITARRALPVLATLFLLSYTKVLRSVSSVLFYYSTITHLPSGHTTVVWAVDANVPLFGLKYTALFIVCLILFIILLPFNAILCFTKTAMRLKLVNHFKPLIDAYQGPYKYKYYYWAGLHLVIRAVFFGLSALDRNVNLTVGIILLAIIIVIQRSLIPFKNNYKNLHETSFLFNLLVMYVLSHDHYDIAVIVMITMAAVHFLLIIIHHIISNVCGGVIMHKLKIITDSTVNWITRPQNKPQHIQLNNIPPDKTYNYQELREPLVGQD